MTKRRSRTPDGSLAPAPYDELVYDVATRPFGRIKRFEGKAVGSEQWCWQAIQGNAAPCAGCPAQGATEAVRLGVVHSRRPGRPVILCAARLVDRTTVQVREFRLGAPIIKRVLQVRLDGLCEEAGFTRRQREVLDLILLGRSANDMGVALSISLGTVKFHVATVLKKLGAESRVDLLRLLM
jgi:DNA-binding CsgD family transcriptional regulator